MLLTGIYRQVQLTLGLNSHPVVKAHMGSEGTRKRDPVPSLKKQDEASLACQRPFLNTNKQMPKNVEID